MIGKVYHFSKVFVLCIHFNGNFIIVVNTQGYINLTLAMKVIYHFITNILVSICLSFCTFIFFSQFLKSIICLNRTFFNEETSELLTQRAQVADQLA